MIVFETAFALILLAGAGLLIRTFAGLTAIPPGFHPDHVVTARLSLPSLEISNSERQRAFIDALLEKARSGPGVDAAGAVACLPYAGFLMTGASQIEDTCAAGCASKARTIALPSITPPGDYFKAMGIPILQGRALDSSDARAAHPWRWSTKPWRIAISPREGP